MKCLKGSGSRPLYSAYLLGDIDWGAVFSESMHSCRFAGKWLRATGLKWCAKTQKKGVKKNKTTKVKKEKKKKHFIITCSGVSVPPFSFHLL